MTNVKGAAVGILVILVVVAAAAMPASADKGYPYDGMQVIASAKTFDKLSEALRQSIKTNKMGLVTQASASKGAAAAGIKIPGNLVVGVYRNDFARRMLAASVPAGIEAPLRFYVTENADGTATLTYRRPSAVFAPYGAADLDKMALELDEIFAAIAVSAVK